jgi:hypothetical protein
MLYRLSGIRTHNVGTDCIGNYKSNYHRITTTTAPQEFGENNNLSYKSKYLIISDDSSFEQEFIKDAGIIFS